MNNYFFIEITDTYGGEANYSWVHRYKIKAATIRGAIIKFSKYKGYQGRLKKVMDYGDLTRHDIKGAAICIFTQYFDEYHNQYISLKVI